MARQEKFLDRLRELAPIMPLDLGLNKDKGREHWLKGFKNTAWVSIHGISGSGKTTALNQLLDHARENFPAVAISLRNAPDLESVNAAITLAIRQSGLAQTSEEESNLGDLALRLNGDDKKFFIFVDDADVPGAKGYTTPIENAVWETIKRSRITGEDFPTIVIATGTKRDRLEIHSFYLRDYTTRPPRPMPMLEPFQIRWMVEDTFGSPPDDDLAKIIWYFSRGLPVLASDMIKQGTALTLTTAREITRSYIHELTQDLPERYARALPALAHIGRFRLGEPSREISPGYSHFLLARHAYAYWDAEDKEVLPANIFTHPLGDIIKAAYPFEETLSR